MTLEGLTVAVAGMGPMGRGIARVFAQAGANVIVSDMTPELTQGGVDAIAAESAADGAVVAVSGAPLAEAVAHADLFIEAIVERMDAKAALLKEVAAAAPAGLIVASNTSSLSVGEMGKEFGDPTRVAGMHFFNPPTKMKLVEVIRGAGTDPAVVSRLVELVVAVGKTAVTCADSPNFIVNRVCRPLYYEAQLLVAEGVEPAVVDAAASGALGHPMGPITLLDFTGLHTHLGSSETALREFGDPKYRPIPGVRALVRNGMTGRAAGRGFYDYAVEKPRAAIERVTRPAPSGQASIAWAGPSAAEQSAGAADVTVYSCHLPPTEADIEAVAQLASSGPVVVDSSDAGWLEVLPAGAEWARIHGSFVEVVDDAVAGVVPGRGVELVLAALGATSVRVPALPGLVADRLANCMANEASFLVEEGTASKADVDVALRLGMNHPSGPFEYTDRVGVQQVHAGLRSMLAAFGDSRYRPSQLMRRENAGAER
ncbi:3-hydroxybutyryl-CoA dehydrogenase [Microbacterium sp. W4I4]|uniref:3-hydroxyacyl-CoA dehydrogenase n=1 Tax=Microbacterium sp. W4I4 TaxID=3042295 RepID=UPI0027872A4B|nr:3-hydroxyacyl-CoA dehydrogenase NAD-binding domain-containing protein [Microbacterium sp. W4I4]MDQ0614277.1 3-hydroxybutyryl-CoA dehydrogenase [Microbacterium sp. W4I4]